jgi:signal peptidase
MTRARKWTRQALVFLTWTLSGAAAALFLALALSLAIGQRPVVVLSGSMSPAIEPGDILVERKIAPRDARIGDVITFREPAGERRLLTHRVRSVRARGERVTIVTKGDANNSVERFVVAAGDEVGTPAWRIPALGYVTTFVRTPIGLIVAIFAPLLVLAFLELRDIWGPFHPPRLRLPHHRRPHHGAHA